MLKARQFVLLLLAAGFFTFAGFACAHLDYFGWTTAVPVVVGFLAILAAINLDAYDTVVAGSKTEIQNPYEELTYYDTL